jgi:hypothetical protein
MRMCILTLVQRPGRWRHRGVRVPPTKTQPPNPRRRIPSRPSERTLSFWRSALRSDRPQCFGPSWDSTDTSLERLLPEQTCQQEWQERAIDGDSVSGKRPPMCKEDPHLPDSPSAPPRATVCPSRRAEPRAGRWTDRSVGRTLAPKRYRHMPRIGRHVSPAAATYL